MILAATLGPRALAGVDNDGPADGQQAQASSAAEQSSDQGSTQADSSVGDDHDDGDSEGSPAGATKDPWASDQHDQQAQAASADAQETERHLAQAPNQALQQAPPQQQADSDDSDECDRDRCTPLAAGGTSGMDYQEPELSPEQRLSNFERMAGYLGGLGKEALKKLYNDLDDLETENLGNFTEEELKRLRDAKDKVAEAGATATDEIQLDEAPAPQQVPTPADVGRVPSAPNNQAAEPIITTANQAIMDAQELLKLMSHTGSTAAGGPFDSTSTTPPLLTDQPLPNDAMAIAAQQMTAAAQQMTAAAQQVGDAVSALIGALGFGGLAVGGSVGTGVMMERVGAYFCSRQFDCVMFGNE